MPVYLYQDIRDNSIHEVIQSMEEDHRAFAKDGFELQRIYVNPGVGVDTKIDPFSSKDYVRATSKSKDTIGSLFDRAQEMSLKRQDKIGAEDPVKKKYYDSYAAKRHGKRCLQERKEQLDKISKTPIEIKIP